MFWEMDGFLIVVKMVTVVPLPDLLELQGGGRAQCAREQYTVAGSLLGE